MAYLQSGKHTARHYLSGAVLGNTTPLQTGRAQEKIALEGCSLVYKGIQLFEPTPSSDIFVTTKRTEWIRTKRQEGVQIVNQTDPQIRTFKGKVHWYCSTVDLRNGQATISTHRCIRRSHTNHNNAQHGSAESKAPCTEDRLTSVRTQVETCKVVTHESSVVNTSCDTIHSVCDDRPEADPTILSKSSPINSHDDPRFMQYTSNELTDEKLPISQPETPLREGRCMKSTPATPCQCANGFPEVPRYLDKVFQPLQSREGSPVSCSNTVPKQLLSPAGVTVFQFPELSSILTEEIRPEVRNTPTEDICLAETRQELRSGISREETPQDLHSNPKEQLQQELLNNSPEKKHHELGSALPQVMPQESPCIPSEDTRQKSSNIPIGQISQNMPSTENEQELPSCASMSGEVQIHGTSNVSDEALTENCDPVSSAVQQHGFTFSIPVQVSNATADNTVTIQIATTPETTEIQQRSHTLHRNRRNKAKQRKQQFDVVYRMTSRPKGICIIINIEKFLGDRFERRDGTAADKESLRASFEQLGFQVKCFDDLSANGIVRVILEKAMDDHGQHDCFVCCILSHGNLRTVYGSNGLAVKIEDIIRPFRAQACPSLAGKPKVFIIQACQGEYEQSGHPAACNQTLRHDIAVEKENEKRLVPDEADFLVCFSTVPGTRSYRHPSTGSLYIRHLTQHLTKQHHFMDILTLVNNDVGKEEIVGRGGMCKQSPYFESSLMKFLYLSGTPGSRYTNPGSH